MSETGEARNTVAPIRNVGLLSALAAKVLEREPSMPGLGVFYGPSGFGKSTAAAFAQISYNAIVIEMRSIYTVKTVLQKIAIEAEVESAGTSAAILDRIAQKLVRTGQLLIIDEADFLVKKNLIEVVRDILEASQGSVILIGEERLPAKLAKWERVHGRVLDWVAAEPASFEDAKHLAGLYCRGIEVDDEVLARLFRESGPSTRRIAVNLNFLRDRASVLGRSRIQAGDVDDKSFSAGRAPMPRVFQ